MTDYVFTSISPNYIPKARVLAQSVKECSPKARFCLLLAQTGHAPAEATSWEFDEVVTLDDLGIPNLRSWLFQHRLVELCTAIKGFFLELILDRQDCESVFYFDPDIVVFSSLSELKSHFDHGSVLLTPHLTAPDQTLEAIRDNEMAALRHGVYNLGFLGVANTLGGLEFARWWRHRLQHFCRDAIPSGLFTDQRWVDLAPAFFEDLAIVRDPGWNVATWNLTHRHVEGEVETGFTVNGTPLRFYHFSGLDSGAQLAMLDKYGRSMPALYSLRAWYLKRCAALDALELGASAWPHDFFDNGVRIRTEHRMLYRHRSDLQQAFPNPFFTDEVNSSYLHWFEANQEETESADAEPSALVALYKRELEAIYASRSWKLASLIRRLGRPASTALRSLRMSMGRQE